MKNRIFVLFFSFVFCCTLTSCLEVYETVHFKKDGSGTMEIKSDYSKLIGLMGNLSETTEGEESEGGSLGEKLKESFD